jgi:hypothetical protein
MFTRYAGVWRDLDLLERGRTAGIALDEHRHCQRRGGVFDGGDQVDVVGRRSPAGRKAHLAPAGFHRRGPSAYGVSGVGIGVAGWGCSCCC